MHGRECLGHHGNYVNDTWKKPSSLQAKRISLMTRGLREGLWREETSIMGRVVEGFKWRAWFGRSEGGRRKRSGMWGTPIWFSVMALVNEFVSESSLSPSIELSLTSSIIWLYLLLLQWTILGGGLAPGLPLFIARNYYMIFVFSLWKLSSSCNVWAIVLTL